MWDCPAIHWTYFLLFLSIQWDHIFQTLAIECGHITKCWSIKCQQAWYLLVILSVGWQTSRTDITLLKMQVLKWCSSPTESESPGMEHKNLHALLSMSSWCMSQFEKFWDTPHPDLALKDFPHDLCYFRLFSFFWLDTDGLLPSHSQENRSSIRNIIL
jgi:hypothetical protein